MLKAMDACQQVGGKSLVVLLKQYRTQPRHLASCFMARPSTVDKGRTKTGIRELVKPYSRVCLAWLWEN
jgi:hypothetical protein